MSEINLRKNLVEFTLGADPEFACFTKSGDVVRANEFCTGSEKFGADGNGVTFELRPDPSPNPHQIVWNIQNILAKKVEEKPNFLKWSWLAGSHQKGYPLGGHIHFGVKKDKIDAIEASAILSQYLGATTMLLEDTKQGMERRKGSYGGMEDCRTDKPYGFEYRTLSSWLVCPYIADSVMCLAKTVMSEMLNNKAFKPGFYVHNSSFSKMNVEPVFEKFPNIWDDITKMHLYPTYKKQLDLLNYLVTRKLTWFRKTDMKLAWGLINMRATQANVTLGSIWDNYFEEEKAKKKETASGLRGFNAPEVSYGTF
jgi:hypothetical protein